MKLRKSLGFGQIFIETDFELVVNWVKNKLCNSWYFWNLWKILLEELERVSFMIDHIFRESNQVADFLARRGEGVVR